MPEPWLAERRQPRDSLATKIIFFVFLSTFVTSLVVSWISVHSTHGFLRAHLEESYPALLERADERLAQATGEALASLEQLAREPALVAAIDGDDDAVTRAEALLAPRRARAGSSSQAASWRRLVLFDAAGAPRIEIGEGPSLPAADANAPPLRALGDALVARAPIHDADGTEIGSLEALLAPASQLLGLAGDARAGAIVHLVDAAGRVLAVAGDGAASPFTAFPVELMDAGASAPLVEFRSAEGRRAIGASRPLAIAGWRLVAAQPTERAFAPVFAVVTRIFVIDLAVVLLFSFLAYEITSAIVRPLEQLSDAARRISQGELEVELAEHRRRDEIGLLTRTFNDMARRLRRNRSEIEQQHRQLREQNEQLQQANEVLEQLSITDGLTKLHNHRYFQETLTREIKRVSRTGESLSILLIDIDDFKALNDRLGHAAGDAVLVRIARILNESVRESDVLARYGGEEFVVLATGTDLAQAVYVAEKVRTAVVESSFGTDPSGEPMRITVSIGVASYDGDRRRFFDTADRALYRAKAAGKNCVVSADEWFEGQS